jgi:hypothetical protein
MTNFPNFCPKTDIMLDPIVGKAIEMAIKVTAEIRSSVTDDDYYIFMLALCTFLEPQSGPNYEYTGLSLATDLMQQAILDDDPQVALDKLRAALWTVENPNDEDELITSEPEDRDEDIAQLRRILTYWRSSEMSIVWRDSKTPIEKLLGARGNRKKAN